MYCSECRKQGIASLMTKFGVCPLCKAGDSGNVARDVAEQIAKSFEKSINESPDTVFADDAFQRELDGIREALGCEGLIISGIGGRVDGVVVLGAIGDLDRFVLKTIESLGALPSPIKKKPLVNFHRIMALAPKDRGDIGWFLGNLIQAALAVLSVVLGKRQLQEGEITPAVKAVGESMQEQFRAIPKTSELN